MRTKNWLTFFDKIFQVKCRHNKTNSNIRKIFVLTIVRKEFRYLINLYQFEMCFGVESFHKDYPTALCVV